VKTGACNLSRFETLVEQLRTSRNLENHGAMILLQCVGDLMYYWLLHCEQLLPGWLTDWGFVGLAPAAAASMLILARRLVVMSRPYLASTAVLALQPVTLAIWLIAGDSER
jgi:hypothetical protein